MDSKARKKNIRRAVIPAAGFGTRFLPASKSQPKEMLVVVDKPLIQYSVEEAVGSGIRSIGIVTSRRKSSIEDYFSQNPEIEEFLRKRGKSDLLEEVRRIARLAEFTYIRQRKALGLGHAILKAEKYIGDEPFAVLLPDDIFDCFTPCIKQLIDIFSELKSSVVVLGRMDEEGTRKCGVIKPRQISERVFQVEDVIEKPGPERAFSDLGVLGRYVFTPRIFEAIKKTAPDKNGEVQITDAFRELLRKEPVYGYLFEGRFFDVGHKLGFIQATIELALKRPEFRENLKKIIKSLP